jgi:hypothetical protein
MAPEAPAFRCKPAILSRFDVIFPFQCNKNRIVHQETGTLTVPERPRMEDGLLDRLYVQVSCGCQGPGR